MHMVVGLVLLFMRVCPVVDLITSKTLCYNSRVLTRKTVQSDRLELVHQCAGTVRELDPPSRRGAYGALNAPFIPKFRSIQNFMCNGQVKLMVLSLPRVWTSIWHIGG